MHLFVTKIYPSIYQFYAQQGKVVVLLHWHFNSNEDINTKFKWHRFQIIRINKKKFGSSGIILPKFPPSWKWSFLAIFHNIEPSARTAYNPVFIILKFLECSNNLIQKNKNGLYNPFNLSNQPFASIFQKLCLECFMITTKYYQRPDPFRAIPSICFRGPWILWKRKTNHNFF